MRIKKEKTCSFFSVAGFYIPFFFSNLLCLPPFTLHPTRPPPPTEDLIARGGSNDPEQLFISKQFSPSRGLSFRSPSTHQVAYTSALPVISLLTSQTNEAICVPKCVNINYFQRSSIELCMNQSSKINYVYEISYSQNQYYDLLTKCMYKIQIYMLYITVYIQNETIASTRKKLL